MEKSLNWQTFSYNSHPRKIYDCACATGGGLTKFNPVKSKVAPQSIPTAKDKLLFTPGPLTTSLTVKQAMLHDAGSWHFEFNARVRWIREKLLEVAGLSREDGYEVVLLQGSGTYAVEAVFSTCLPPRGKVAVLA